MDEVLENLYYRGGDADVTEERLEGSCLTLCSLGISLQVDTCAGDRATSSQLITGGKSAQALMSLVEHNSSNCSNWVSVRPERVALVN